MMTRSPTFYYFTTCADLAQNLFFRFNYEIKANHHLMTGQNIELNLPLDEVRGENF